MAQNPRQVIVIDSNQEPDGSVSLTVAFWLVSPGGKQKPDPSLRSAVPSSAAVSWGCTAAELTQLQNGSTVEQVVTTGAYAPSMTQPQIEADLKTQYDAAQAALNASATTIHWIGTFTSDGITWTGGP